MIQINMEKPNHCLRCPMRNSDDGCVLIQENDPSWDWEEQYANCPLQEVKLERKKVTTMTIDQAIYILRNTAWLGTSEDVENVEQAVSMAVEALERKKGKWIKIPEFCGDDVSGFIDNHFSCSECKKEAEINPWGFYILSDFCPNCGADMRGWWIKMTVAEKISALNEEREELVERYCENCQEWCCDNCWAEWRGDRE